MKKTYNIEIDCANCANLVEAAVGRIEGVDRVTVSFITGKMKICFTEGADPEAVMSHVVQIAKSIEPDFAIISPL